ncbi:MAG TPA: hypothetical protein DCE44_07280 [Verrucomicrobiales bacterium]|nr:hypothetical protein [Verrucomicrobiales bacterium]
MVANAEAGITNYAVTGVVRSLKPEDKTVVIRHEEIPGYMIAMTMPFTVRDSKELAGVNPGDGVAFRMRVTANDAWIDEVRVTSNAPPALAVTDNATKTNAQAGYRVLPTVPELQVGQMVPNYSFTNQLGKRFDLRSFHGQALAVTFIFTRCPFPLFCPKMSDAFGATQRLLAARSAGPTNWHLLSLTFDPEFDSPAIMKAYGQRWKADPEHWTLATGGFDQIEPFAISTGLYFGREVSIANQNHNLRTLVIDPQGKLAKVFVGNEWTPEQLAEAIVTAAATPKS